MAGFTRWLHKLGIRLKLRDPPNLPPHGWSYLDHIVAVYVTLNTGDPRADAVIKKAKEDPDALTWGDVFLLESVTFSLQPPEIVERSAWVLRERLRLTASADVYAKYLESSPPSPKDTSPAAKLTLLKADLTRVLDLLHWHYSLSPIREHIRKSLTVSCIWLTVMYTVLLCFALIWFHKHEWDFAAMILCVVYCGVVGGFVSSQRRMQNIPSDTEPLISIFGLDSAGYFLWLSPLLGAIFAVVLTSMFIGGILKGTVFPNFLLVAHKDAGMRLFEFAGSALPTGTEDYAKLYVWAFLAGFAERLVPDSLDRLTKLGQDKHPNGPPPPPPPGNGPGGPPHPPGDESRDKPKPVVTAATVENALHTGVLPEEPPEEPGP